MTSRQLSPNPIGRSEHPSRSQNPRKLEREDAVVKAREIGGEGIPAVLADVLTEAMGEDDARLANAPEAGVERSSVVGGQGERLYGRGVGVGLAGASGSANTDATGRGVANGRPDELSGSDGVVAPVAAEHAIDVRQRIRLSRLPGPGVRRVNMAD